MLKTHAAVELQEVSRPISSLISKSEKARQKLTAGTWQHTMLTGNLRALRLVSALIDGPKDDGEVATPAVLQAAVHSLAELVAKTVKAQTKSLPGTSQHTLLRNRLHALETAEALIKAQLKDCGP